MAASRVWTLIVGLVAALVALGGAAWWSRQPPGTGAPVGLAANAPAASAPDTSPRNPTAPAPTAPAPMPAASMDPARHADGPPQPPSQAASLAGLDRGPAPPSAPAPEPAPAGAGDPPHFDVVRVERDGGTVVAGQGAPDATVAVIASGKVIAETKADSDGHFVVVPPSLAPGDHALSLRQSKGAVTTPSRQSIAVSVPRRPQDKVVVALAESGKPTTLLSPERDARASNRPGRGAASRPLPDQHAKLGIASVELENGSGFLASGSAPTGSDVRVYLNNSHIADVVAGPDGRWSVTLRKGLAAGHYTVRADAAEGAQDVQARAEVPFDVPVAMAEALAPSTPAPSTSATSTAAASRPAPPSAAPPPSAPSRGPAATAPATAAAAGSATVPATDAASQGTMVASATRVPAVSMQDAVVDEVLTAQVVRGDNLWAISRTRLGHGTRYTQIYAANAAQIRDPKLIYPGQIFVMPRN